MTNGQTPTRAKFVITYLAVFALMLGWWLTLQASTTIGVPIVTVIVAYAAPVAAWLGVRAVAGERGSDT